MRVEGGGAVTAMGMQGGRRGMLEVSPPGEDEVKVKAGSPRVVPRLPIQLLAGREDKVKRLAALIKQMYLPAPLPGVAAWSASYLVFRELSERPRLKQTFLLFGSLCCVRSEIIAWKREGSPT